MHVDELTQRFRACFPEAGEPFLCRAPGRVNIIGEHLDYNGLPVLPAALPQAIHAAFAPRGDGQFRLANTSANYPDAAFENAAAISPSPAGSWENYCKAAVQGLNQAGDLPSEKGLDMLVHGEAPAAIGLSSSSAMVVACAMAYLAANDLVLGQDLDRLELAEVLAEAEHYLGTRGGGMDQATILCAQEGHACKIGFYPLQVEHVPFPEDAVLLVCDSLESAEKSGAARDKYNSGPAACAIAAAMLERHLQEEVDPAFELPRLGELLLGPLCLTYREAAAMGTEVFSKDVYTLEDIAAQLECDTQALRERFLGDLALPAEGLPLRARFRHIISESQRVEAARDALWNGDLHELGRLMNASHESCARDYGISTAALDELAACARECGALGARLTGAGFGGAVVCLTTAEQADRVHAGIASDFYGRRGVSAPERMMFQAQPGAGAQYL